VCPKAREPPPIIDNIKDKAVMSAPLRRGLFDCNTDNRGDDSPACGSRLLNRYKINFINHTTGILIQP
jgi:hypothetical protein